MIDNKLIVENIALQRQLIELTEAYWGQKKKNAEQADTIKNQIHLHRSQELEIERLTGLLQPFIS